MSHDPQIAILGDEILALRRELKALRRYVDDVDRNAHHAQDRAEDALRDVGDLRQRVDEIEWTPR